MIARALGFGVAGLLLLCAACGEKAQTQDAAAKKPDAQPWALSDAAEPAFAASGWKPGDKAEWEAQIRKRNQAQNDYAR